SASDRLVARLTAEVKELREGLDATLEALDAVAECEGLADFLAACAPALAPLLVGLYPRALQRLRRNAAKSLRLGVAVDCEGAVDGDEVTLGGWDITVEVCVAEPSAGAGTAHGPLGGVRTFWAGGSTWWVAAPPFVQGAVQHPERHGADIDAVLGALAQPGLVVPAGDVCPTAGGVAAALGSDGAGPVVGASSDVDVECKDTDDLDNLSARQQRTATLVIQTGRSTADILAAMLGGLCPVCLSPRLLPRKAPRPIDGDDAFVCELCMEPVELDELFLLFVPEALIVLSRFA
ncbi:unnamed protein product, partial [Prorocentrum cordatum]